MDSNSRHGRAATEEELTALPPPETDADSSDAPSIQTLQDRYAAATSAGVFEARLLMGAAARRHAAAARSAESEDRGEAGEGGSQLNIG